MAKELASPLSWMLIVLVVVGIVVIGVALTVLPRYVRYMEQARARQQSFGSQVIDTACGRVEYATAGDGAPVLVVHGASGGYDQGIIIGQPNLGEGFRIIAPSRFGYQRTPVPSDVSPAAQADAYACLLDALGISKVGVLGISAGGPSALQFALRHPARVSGLVLMVPAAYSPEPPTDIRSPSAAIMLAAVLKSDFLLWAATKIAPQALLSDMGVPLPIQQQLTPEQKNEFMGWLFPFDTRVDGLMNEGKSLSNLGPSPLEQITAPTLVISAKDDLFRTYGPAEYTAKHIPNAEFVGYDTGGHLLNGHEEDVASKISALLQRHSP
jgi:pimeloyl-ACP methyl ester carboxylesterase